MQPAQIADIVIGIFFLMSMAIGYHRGLIRTIAGIVAMVASYLGALFLATVGKEPLAQMVLIPLVEKRAASSPLGALAGDAIARAAEGLSYSLIFGVSFAILQFILFWVVRSLQFIDDIPVIGKLNKLGGAVLGFLWVFLLCLLLGNVFFTYVPKELRKQWGFGKKAVEQTVLLDAFMPQKTSGKK